VLIITIKENVEQLLREDEKCRNDDMYLNLKYWKKFNNLELDLSIFEKLTKTESIRRSRQNIQNDEDKFPPTDPIVRAYREKNRGKSYK
jgi:predicted NACHT family NTPase